MDQNFEVIQNAPLRVFSKKLFTEKPNLFLFGEKVAFYDKDEEKWFVESFSGKEPIDLPWMGFEIVLTRHETTLIPSYTPEYTLPIQKDGKIIKGSTRALKIDALGKKYWIRDDQAITLRIKGQKYKIELEKKSLKLPYELSLTKFKMDTDPGTNSPASYESFVQLFTKNGPSDHHIYMNNPLKYEGLTFYQASYFDMGKDNTVVF